MINKGQATEALDFVTCNGSWRFQMLQMLHVASMCTHDDPAKCPNMLQVVKFLGDIEGHTQTFG